MPATPIPGVAYLDRNQDLSQHTVDLFAVLDPNPHWVEDRRGTGGTLFTTQPGTPRGRILVLNVHSNLTWVKQDARELVALAANPDALLRDQLGGYSPLQRNGLCVLTMARTSLLALDKATKRFEAAAAVPAELGFSGVSSYGGYLYANGARERTLALETTQSGTLTDLGRWLSSMSMTDLVPFTGRGLFTHRPALV